MAADRRLVFGSPEANRIADSNRIEREERELDAALDRALESCVAGICDGVNCDHIVVVYDDEPADRTSEKP